MPSRSSVARSIAARRSSWDSACSAASSSRVRARVAVYQDALDGYWDVQEIFSAGDRVIARVRDPDDRRRLLVELTPAGARALKRLDRFVQSDA